MNHIKKYFKEYVILLFIIILFFFSTMYIAQLDRNNKRKNSSTPSKINSSISLLKMKYEHTPKIRVLLKNEKGGIYWENYSYKAEYDTKLTTIRYNTLEEKDILIGEEILFDREYSKAQDMVCYLSNEAEDILEIHFSNQGIYLINELPVEEYLRYVVPGEMPASYPLEALKAQAICARTYAYKCLLNPGYPKLDAHLDNSCNYQVFHRGICYPSTDQAIEETKEMYLCDCKDQLYDVYYYSTSWGQQADTSVWDTFHMNHSFQSLIDENLDLDSFKIEHKEDTEYQEKYYRWKYMITDTNNKCVMEVLTNILNSKSSDIIIEKKKIKDPLEIENISVLEYGAGLSVIRLCLDTNQGKILILGENSIRKVIGAMSGTLILNDESKKQDIEMLPSSFFTIEKAEESPYKYILFGGGYGHGIGLSQNGAKNLALQEYNYKEILGVYFPTGHITR